MAQTDPARELLKLSKCDGPEYEGKRFIFHHASVIPAGNDQDILIKTNGVDVYSVIHGSLADKSNIKMYDAPTVADVGTEITGHSSSLGYGTVPITQVFHTPTVTNLGTKVDTDVFIPTKVMGADCNRKKIKSNRLVLLRVHAQEDTDASIKIDIYELN